jgi:hypothetical protein
MLRPLLIILISTALLLFFIGYPVSHLAPYLISHIKSTLKLGSDPYSIESMPLETLESLTNVPLVGELFLEEKLMILVRTKSWHKVLAECSKARYLMKTALTLLPMRAVAECATFQFLKC